jgi:hypothetical protein
MRRIDRHVAKKLVDAFDRPQHVGSDGLAFLLRWPGQAKRDT